MLRELGFDGVAYSQWLNENLEKNLRIVDEAGLAVYMLEASVNVNPKEPPYPPQLPEVIRKLKGRPVTISVTLRGFPPGDPRGEEPATKILRGLGDIAAQCGLRISIYNHTGDWTASLPYALKIVKKADHPQVGANFNLCHWLMVDGDQDYRPVLRENAAKIFAVTINGAQIGSKTWTNGLIQPLDRGNFDNRQLLATLREAGYRGPIGLMSYGIPGDAREHLERSMKVWTSWQSERAKKAVKAASFGFDPADATRALQAAIDSGAAKVIVENLGKPWIVDRIALASNQEIVFEKGVEVLAKKGAFKGTGDSLFRAHLKQNVTLTGYGATLRMRRSDYAGPDYKKAEWRHVLDLRSCTSVRISGLTLAESGGDGIYLGTAKDGIPNKDVCIRNVICDKNYRQGISVINAENLLIEDCVLSNTAGTAPQAGIDFEPNGPEERVVHCTLRRCISQNNAGSGFLLAIPYLNASSAPVSLRFEQCRSVGDGQTAVSIYTGNPPEKAVKGTIEFVDCVFQASKSTGLLVADKPAAGCHLCFERCSLVDVAAAEPQGAPIVLMAGHEATQPLGGIELADCTIRDPKPRKPMLLADAAGGIGLKDITGRLTLDSGARQTTVAITEKQLAEWIPSAALRAIPRLSLPNLALRPMAGRQSWKPDSLAFARLRQTARLVLFAAQGDQVTLRLRHARVANYGGTPIPLVVLSPSGSQVHRASLPFQQNTEVRFQAAATGLYRITAEPGLNCVQVAFSSHPVALSGEEGPIHFIGTPGEFFFQVPAGTGQFGVRVCGEGLAEGVKASLVDPRGKVVQQQDDVAQLRQFEMTRPDASAAETWGVRLARPSHLVMEDHYVDLRGVPPLLTTSREGLLCVEP
jgi:sugar phosphate isomerase/epimerase